MQRKIELTFNGVTALIESDGEGFFNLNDIWHSFKLPDSKRPSQWRDRTRDLLLRCAKLHSVNGDKGKTLADEDALYAYAMWVSPEFALVVIAAFRNLVRGDVGAALDEAVKVARDPLEQLLRDRYNSNKPNRHWQKVARQYLLDDPWAGYERIMKAYGGAQLGSKPKDDFFKQIRKIIEGMIKDSGSFQLISNLEAVGRQFVFSYLLWLR